jgi:lysophospholipase L1-like esterase
MYATLINEKLKDWCSSCKGEEEVGGGGVGALVHYVPFPIETYDPTSGYWSPDGLHFSPEGYKFIGESLAPIIANILNSKG